MKTIYNDLVKVRNPETGAFEGLTAIRGESAYEIAVRLGTFSGTEEEWSNSLNQLKEDLQTTDQIARGAMADAYTANAYAQEAYNGVVELREQTVELTQAEYDALPDTKLTDNVTYFITDGYASTSSSLTTKSELLYSNDQFANTIELTESFRNFDVIIVASADFQNVKWFSTSVYMTESISDGNNIIGVNNETYSIWYTVTSDTEWAFKTRSKDSYILTSVYGLKFNVDVTNDKTIPAIIRNGITYGGGSIGGSSESNLIGDISGFTSSEYPTLGSFLQYCVDNGYLPNMQNLSLIAPAYNNSMPSGNVIYNHYKGNSHPADGYGSDGLQYYAFDGSDTTCVSIDAENVAGAWIGYEFNTVKTVKKIKVKAGNCRSSNSFNVKYQVSIGDSWTDTGVEFVVTSYDNGMFGVFEYELSEPISATKHRLYVVDTKTNATNVFIVSFELFGE